MFAVDDMRDPRHYQNVLKPPLEAEPLPSWCYTSDAFHKLEVERIFMRVWNFVGRADLLANPGDYLATDVAGVPILLVRNRAGDIRAFANSCRHRGTQLLTGEGQCSAITCPYHSWVYSLDGDLVSAVGMEETIGFERTDYGLIPIRLESWAGFLFVNFDVGAESLETFLGNLPDHIACYNFPDLVTTRRQVWDVACNWKVYLENQRESYHVPTVHRESLGDQIAAPLEAEGNWSGSLIGVEQTAAIMKGETSPFPRIASLSDEAQTGSHFFAIYPNTYLVATLDCFWWMECKPRGPERTIVTVGSGFPRSTVARDDFDTVVERYYTRWDTSHPEDNRICEQQQIGLNSPFALPGRLARREYGVNAVDRWVVERILEG